MEPKGKLPDNWKTDLWKSMDEEDVMQLRNKLTNIHNQTENEIQSYNMNSANYTDTKS